MTGIYTGKASAGCTLANDAGFTTIGNASVVVDSDIPVNSVFRTIEDTGGGQSVKCDQDYRVSVRSSNLEDGMETNSDVRELRVGQRPSGVGVRIRWKNPDSDDFYSLPDTRNTTLKKSINDSGDLWRSAARIEYVKMRNVVSYGPVDEDYVARSLVDNRDGVISSGLLTLRRGRVRALTFVRPTCAINTANLNQTVEFDQHAVSDFENQQATAWVNFELRLENCGAPVETVADITFGQLGDAVPNRPDLFSMNVGGPGGLGIAIQSVNPNAVAMTPGAARTLNLSDATDQAYAFQARLERTDGAVTPGEVERPVTVRVTFR